MKLWIDDFREPPDESWLWAKTSDEALHILRNQPVDFIAFDHDLGGEDTAYRVAVAIEHRAATRGIAPPGWSIHSANPVGTARIRDAMEAAEWNWKRHLKAGVAK